MATDDVAALKARIAELEQQTTRRRRFDGRGLTAWVLVVVAAILFPIALTAYWGQRTLTDTERYVATVAPLAQDPTIQKAVAETVTNALVTQLDAQNRVSGLLTDYPRLQPLAGPIATGVNNFIAQQVQNVLASDQFDSFWVAVNRKAQQALVAALSGNPTGAVTIQGDQVVLDTGDIIEAVKQRLVDRGLTFAANIPVPPAADREVVLLTSPQLQTARTAYALGQPVAQWLIYVVLLMFLLAVLVSRHRARMTIAVGVALAIGAVVLRLAMVVADNQLELTLAGTPFATAEAAFFLILTSFLLTAVRAVFVLGLVLALVGWYLSGTTSATTTRHAVSGLVGGAGARASGTAIAPVGAWFARTRTFWRVAIVVVAVVVLLASSPLTGATILWTAVVAAAAIVVVELLAAAGSGAVDEVGGTGADGAVGATPTVPPDTSATVDVSGSGTSTSGPPTT